jgi:hypothetical protein
MSVDADAVAGESTADLGPREPSEHLDRRDQASTTPGRLFPAPPVARITFPRRWQGGVSGTLPPVDVQ